ncbi:hypothetical protein LTV02_16430 [Nocardia yamanashiensis]|uniref:hypothetical protein n=1 Tax=Nocardia yamanashiensis TaxID=209247 RepID=UPI000B05F79E|nr:hypothetical protein [Nocardia yamanashiensis]UGT44883.1 hypothetical protein LTV02_16430 [Nocardia yamanashiensis]
MRSIASGLVRVGVVAPMALATVFALAAPANAAGVSMNWSCQGTIFGIGQTSSMSTSVDGTAPSSAAAGSAVAITLTPGASSVPSSASGFTVQNISNLKMTWPAPTNSTVVSASVSGGTVAGTVSTAGGNITLTVPGPIAGGSSFTPPAVTINVTAGAAGTPITTKYAGTSYASPGMTMTTKVAFVGNVATACYPNPSPTLTTTNVV